MASKSNLKKNKRAEAKKSREEEKEDNDGNDSRGANSLQAKRVNSSGQTK